jgi:hypothetical protein
MPPKVIHKSAISTDSHTGLIECEDLNLIDRVKVTLKRIAAKDHQICIKSHRNATYAIFFKQLIGNTFRVRGK